MEFKIPSILKLSFGLNVWDSHSIIATILSVLECTQERTDLETRYPKAVKNKTWVDILR